jgi:glycosyltransferase involved in cell wall biosynthesis
LRDRVPEAVGFVPPGELGAYYERAAVVCCPSRREGYGVVAREAMAWGRPVVATTVGGLVDAVVDGETGALVPPGDVRALRASVAELLADSEVRENRGIAARIRARREFSADAVLEPLLHVYDGTPSGGRDAGA